MGNRIFGSFGEFGISVSRAFLVAGTVTLATGTAVARDAPVTFSVEVGARSVAPGEPLRVTVRSSRPIAELKGDFLGMGVAFRARSGPPSTAFTAWTVVPLSHDGGLEALALSGVTPGGDVVRGTHAVEIESREFPVEELNVASKFVAPPAAVLERLENERAELRGIYALRSSPKAEGEPFVRPVPGPPTSTFGTRRFFNGEPRDPHPGLDLRAGVGDEVVASGSGRVVLAMDLYYSGGTVILDHGEGLFTLYAHLSRIDVSEGADVEAGEPVGAAGATGRVTGPHLHWGAKIGDVPFDPRALLDPALFDSP